MRQYRREEFLYRIAENKAIRCRGTVMGIVSDETLAEKNPEVTHKKQHCCSDGSGYLL